MNSTDSTYTVASASTVDMAPDERAEFWVEHVRKNHCKIDFVFPGPRQFAGSTVVQKTSGYQLIDYHEDTIRYFRPRKLVSQDSDDELRLIVPVSGEMRIEVDDRQVTVSPGMGGMLSGNTPFSVIHDGVRAVVFTASKHEISTVAPGCVDLRRGLGAILCGMVKQTARERDHLTQVEFDLVCSRIADLIRQLATSDKSPSGLNVVEHAFRKYVERFSDDPNLTGASVARNLGWSLRQAQLALQLADTTPSAVIRNQRLERVHERLADPAFDSYGILEIALMSGFSSATTFSDSFHKRYGCSPRERRNAARRDSARTCAR